MSVRLAVVLSWFAGIAYTDLAHVLTWWGSLLICLPFSAALIWIIIRTEARG